MDKINQRWIDRYISTSQYIDLNKATELLGILYDYINAPAPIVIIVDSPSDVDYPVTVGNSNYGIFTDYPWLCQYELDVQKGTCQKSKLIDLLVDIVSLDFYMLYTLETHCIIVRNPKEMHYRIVDKRVIFHNTTGPALKWDNDGIYAINGKLCPKELITEPITYEQFMHENNMEIKSMMHEILGPDKLIELMDAYVADTTTLKHRDNRTEVIDLLKTKRVDPLIKKHLTWVRMSCPTTGSVYTIDCDPKYTNVVDAHASLTILDRNEILQGYSQHS